MKAITYCTLAVLLGSMAAATWIQAASTIRFTAADITVPEWTGNVSLSVERLGDHTSPLMVDYATADGTATAGLKFIATNGTLAFAADESNKPVVVQILNQGFVEGPQTFDVVLSKPTDGAALGDPTTAKVTILDVDTGINFQFQGYSIANRNPLYEGTGEVLIGVVRGDDADFPVTVDIVTSDITAISGLDYTGVTNTLSFAPQERLKFVPIPILNDSLKEAIKTFKATLSNPVGVTLGGTRATVVTIIDDDQGFQFETNAYYVGEDAGVALIGVLRGTDDTNSSVSVDLTSADSAPISRLDYIGFTNTVSFSPGQRRVVVAIPILNDGIKESVENFKLTLSNPSGGAMLGSPTAAAVYIQDNDPGVGFELAVHANAWGQAADFALTVLRGNDGALGAFTVDYVSGDGTATPGEDYQAVSGTLTFQENETSKRLNIPILRPRAVGTARPFK